MNILIGLSDKVSSLWSQSIGKLNMSVKLFEYRYREEYMKFAQDAYCERQEIISAIENQFVAPIVFIRNKYEWSIYASHKVIAMGVDDAFVEQELAHLRKNKIPFVASNGEHSDDKFGNDEDMVKLLKEYDDTQPPKVGFNAK